MLKNADQYGYIGENNRAFLYPFEIKITSHELLDAYSEAAFLTEGYNFVYNTALGKDIELYLKNNMDTQKITVEKREITGRKKIYEPIIFCQQIFLVKELNPKLSN